MAKPEGPNENSVPDTVDPGPPSLRVIPDTAIAVGLAVKVGPPRTNVVEGMKSGKWGGCPNY